MKSIFIRGVLFGLCATAMLAQQQDNGGWRRFEDASPASAPPQGAPSASGPYSNAPGPYTNAPNNAPRPYPNGPVPNYGPPAPAQLTVPAGTWISIRVNDPISSDHNHQGDGFTATLVQPLIAQGFVVARRGQMLGGRVAEALKAGRVKGTSQLAVELTDLTLVDGQRIPLKTELVQYAGGTSVGRDATAVGVTTGTGAAIGAIAAGGLGAGLGAAAGAGASIIGVLVTRGRQTVIFPEDTLTFRTSAPITISTEGAPTAFRQARPEDYESRPNVQRRPAVAVARPAYPYPYPYPYAYGPYWGGPFYGGGIYIGGRFGH